MNQQKRDGNAEAHSGVYEISDHSSTSVSELMKPAQVMVQKSIALICVNMWVILNNMGPF